jgi:signal transduction histidine kinase/ligand-binding sensor domain-containing protein
MYSDKSGYIWIGTTDGLMRFDGHEIKTFRSSSITPGRMTGNEVRDIVADNSNRIWIGTSEGLMYLDPDKFHLEVLNIAPLKHQRINSIICDYEGQLWVGTQFNGIVKINPLTLQFEHFHTNSNSSLKLRTNTVVSLYEDSRNRIWVTSWKEGMSLISKNRNNIEFLPEVGFSDNTVRVYEDRDGLIWLATWDNGVYYVQENENEKISYHQFKLSGQSSAGIYKIVFDIVQDPKLNLIWLVTYNGLVATSKNNDGSLTVLSSEQFFPVKLNRTFSKIALDNHGNLWLASVAEGIYRMDFSGGVVSNYSMIKSDKLSVPPHITKICEITPDMLLVSVDRAGPFWYNMKNGTLSKTNNELFNNLNTVGEMIYRKNLQEIWISHLGQDNVHVLKVKDDMTLEFKTNFQLSVLPKSKENSINFMFEDRNNHVWFGTRNGLYLKRQGKNSEKIKTDFKEITSITQDKNGGMWFGTINDGLLYLAPGIAETMVFQKIKLNLDEYECNNIQSLYSGKTGAIYAGTKEGCLFRINPDGQEIIEISSKYGITDNSIVDIDEDTFNNIWLITNTNVIRYNQDTHIANYFNAADGIENNTFFKNTALLHSSGKLLIGGNCGITMINPENCISNGEYNDKYVQITDILINNKSIYDGIEYGVYDAEKNKLKLRHDRNNIKIVFSNLYYPISGKTKYAFKLEGLEDDWHYGVINQNNISYSGLAPGNYTFLVKASNPNGLWSEKLTALKITIQPPFYLTWWAKSILIILVCVILIVILGTYYHKNKISKELIITQIEKKKNEELTQTKLQYFTNISHELLTPLSIISLQIDKLQHKKVIDYSLLDMIKDNVFRLKRLAGQILIFRKAESGNLKLTVSKNEIIGFVRNICEIEFKTQINSKNLNLHFSSEISELHGFYDPDKLDKIIYNLFSNACKYTPENGNIEVNIKLKEKENVQYININIKDDGVGISKEDLPYIFNRFYTGRYNKPEESHGIGLSLVDELVKIHKGSINIQSELNKGTSVEVTIPVSVNYYSDSEIQFISSPETQAEVTPENEDIVIRSKYSKKDFCLLVVEDNRELNELIVKHFRKDYTVYSAYNGVKALQYLRDQHIDLVITDMMMPEMDGITLCKTIRSTPTLIM